MVRQGRCQKFNLVKLSHSQRTQANNNNTIFIVLFKYLRAFWIQCFWSLNAALYHCFSFQQNLLISLKSLNYPSTYYRCLMLIEHDEISYFGQKYAETLLFGLWITTFVYWKHPLQLQNFRQQVDKLPMTAIMMVAENIWSNGLNLSMIQHESPLTSILWSDCLSRVEMRLERIQ